MDKLVSVIIPAYNHENYVKKTIQSILNQTYKNIEIIILDDGSKDDTYKQIKELESLCQNRFVRTIINRQENQGTAVTLNNLISMCLGEYIYIIASDDIALDSAIEKEANFLKEHEEYSLVVADNEFINENGEVLYIDKKENFIKNKEKAAYFTFGQYLQDINHFKFTDEKFGTYKTLYIGNYVPNGYMIRRSIFEKIESYTKEAPLEDWFLMLQISKYSKMKFLDEVLFLYRRHNSNSISNKKLMNEYKEKTRKYEEEILNKVNDNEIRDEVLQVKRYGVLYKRQGLPYIFEVQSYIKSGKKVKKIKFLNITLFSIKKH